MASETQCSGSDVHPNNPSENTVNGERQDEGLSDDSASINNLLKTIDALHSQLKVLLSEAELSTEFVQSAVQSNDTKAAQLEMEDLHRIETEYFSIYKQVIFTSEQAKKSTDELVAWRKSFLNIVKRAKIEAAKIQSDQAATHSGELSTKRLKFTKIDFEIFDGKKDEWMSFKKLFTTYVHESSELSLLEKHQFLRSKLKGEAATLVDSLPIDGTCYKKAWEILLHHYDDPLKKISRHLDAMFQMQPAKGKQLRTLITHFRAQFAALSITFDENKEIDSLSQLIIHLFLNKADKGTRLDWEREIEKRQKFATFDEFIHFMEGRCNAYERAAGASNEQKGHVLLTKAVSNTTPAKCFYCNEMGHRTHQCQKFLAMTIYERNQTIRKRRLCPKCFRGKCDRSCRFKCSKCQGHHNTLLHYERYTKTTNENKESTLSVSEADSPASENKPSSELTTDTLINVVNFYINGWVGCINEAVCPLLATAQLKAFTTDDCQYLEIRSLLDPGSHFNLITSDLALKLNLTRTKTKYHIFGIENISTSSNFSVTLSIKSRVNDFQLKIKCLIIDKIVDVLPSEYISLAGWEFPKHFTLADPTFNIPQGVDLLLGAGVFWKILKPQTTKLKNLTSKIFASQFGWLITGEILNHKFSSNPLCTHISENFDKIVERLWFLDEPSSVKLSLEEINCEEHFLKTYQRDKRGIKFIVSLPFKIPPEQLGESKSQALKRFYALERKLQRNEKLKMEYQKVIDDYINQNHMKMVENDDGSKIKYYMPHRAVIRDDATSTKTRIVFDASEPTTTGLSLNDCLMIGPVVQSDLFSILIRSRMYQYIFSTDISQMYRQIKVRETDTPLLKILWRSNPKELIQTYEVITVPFGLASSPYLATRCLKILAEENPETFKHGKVALLRDCYVDNIFTGADSLEVAVTIKKEIITVLESGGFPLKKWCANNECLLTGIPLEDREKKFPCYFGAEHVIKTLGLIWFPIEDQFKVWVHLKNQSATTKREILSMIASIFDPFGVLAPVIIKAKTLMQNIWKIKVDWDSELPKEIFKIWSALSEDLLKLEHITVPRHVKLHNAECVEIHGFCDASEKAYGGAIYIRSISKGISQCHLLCAKTRVAPLKKTTIARLELCGAVTLIELLESVLFSLRENLNISVIRLWCDSQVVLCWINSHSSRWQPFVANRVVKIQEKQGSAIWDYINTLDNPADFLSRGLSAEQLKIEKLWWHGPMFLTNKAMPFSQEVQFQPSKVQPLEVRQTRKLFVGSLSFRSSLFELYLNYNKLIRITALLQRFIWNLHWFGPYLSGLLECFELKQASITLIRLVQKEHFKNEIGKLVQGENIDKNSRLISLNPFLDEHNIIRVGGRLQHSDLSFEQKYPIVLPNNHTFTKLLIKCEHERNFHSSQQGLRSILRRNFWILKQDTAIQHCILHCVKCIRLKADTKTQIMAALPKARVVPSKVFQNVGIDYAGPVKLLARGGRGIRKIEKKAYIAVFVCFVTKAIHLELVSELTTEAFLAAFDRFVGRRGLPTDIWSDNGTNFVGASKKINELLEFFQYNKYNLTTPINQLGCSWHFIPPHSPSFGGLWEAGVKSVKTHLKRTIGETLFSYEQYETLLIKIEACLNSRPLLLESSDPNDINALTPGHFLIGGPLTALPNTDITEVPINQLKYWELVSKISQVFWKRWKNEYLNRLQQRNKWRQNKNEIKVGDIVLVKEDNSPPLQWPLAKILQIHPGNDNITRVVTVKMKTGTFKRPVSKLVYLPTSVEEN